MPPSPFRFCPCCAKVLEWREVGGASRQVCPDPGCGHVFWGNPVPVVAALVEWQGKMVLARNRAWAEGSFGLITGFLERDESPAAGACREVQEELGLVAKNPQLIGTYDFVAKNEVILAFHVRAEGIMQLNEELAEIRLIAPERLKSWNYGTGLAVADWLDRYGPKA